MSEIFLDRKYLEYDRIAFKVSKNIVDNTIFYNAILDYDLWVQMVVRDRDGGGLTEL